MSLELSHLHRKWYRYDQIEPGKINRLAAYLCQSARVNGKPRQQALYLSSIDPDWLVSIAEQDRFWKDVSAKLNKAGIVGVERERIEALLLQKVARPSAEAVAEAKAKAKAMYEANMNKLLGRL